MTKAEIIAQTLESMNLNDEPEYHGKIFGVDEDDDPKE